MPKICLSLDSSGGPQNETADNGLKDCNSCRVLKRLVCVKDIAINRLSEDREDLKLKLTKINNKNIELTQKLKRLEIEKQVSEQKIKSDNNFDDLKTKYEELEAINRHLRQHLNTLKHVFNEIHNTSESTSNEITTNTPNTSNTSNTSTSASAQTMAKTIDKRRAKCASTLTPQHH